MDYYNTLGVSKGATKDEIKKAYRKLASQHHPDKGGDASRFQAIQEAYETLSDENKRSQYDNPHHEFQFNSHFDFGNFTNGFSDFFSQRGHGRVPRNPDAMVDLNVELIDAYNGRDTMIDVGFAREIIQIPAGVRDGTRIRIHGKGHHRYKEAPPGDLIVRINIKYPQDVSRDGDDIYQRVTVSSLQAIVGDEVTFEHFSGKTLKIKIPKGSQPGSKLRLTGYGMKNPQTHRNGNLFAILNMYTPNITNEEHINILKDINREANK